MKGILLLEDGLELSGTLFGSCGFSGGEIVFNTSMTGYQEILSDPSYYGQLIVMTFPLIGIYGINPDDFESDSPRAAGFIVKEIAPAASNFTAEYSLDAFFRKHNMTGISGIDTRFLTRHIRSRGAMRAVYGPEKTRRDLIEKIKKLPQMQGADLVQYAGCKSRYVYAEAPEGSLKIGVIDCGIKTNILRLLAQDGIKVICYPPRFAIEEISNDNIHGLLLSNGPGDPEPLNYIYEPVRRFFGKIPVYGICLGHQLIGLALGGKTFKLKFGHRGANHPVKNLLTGRIDITSQNHGFCVDPESLDSSKIEITHINLNDQTCEGLRHRELPVASVQYHPEAAPGPNDSGYLIRDFLNIVRKHHHAQA